MLNNPQVSNSDPTSVSSKVRSSYPVAGSYNCIQCELLVYLEMSGIHNPVSRAQDDIIFLLWREEEGMSVKL